MNKSQIENFLPLIVGSIAAVGIFLGLNLRNSLIEDSFIINRVENNEDLVIYEALAHINEKYYGERKEDFTDQVVVSMIDELDDYSHYWNRKSNIDYNHYLDGSYIGRGFELFQKDTSFYITKVLKGSPAFDCKLLRGDEIQQIEGRPVNTLNIDSIQSLLDQKDTINLLIYRHGVDSIFSSRLDYNQIDIPLIEVKKIVNHDLIYIKIDRFSTNVFAEIMGKLDEFKRDEIAVSDIIIDLRDNPGGLLEEAVKLINQLISEPNIVLVSTTNNVQRVQEYKSNGRNFLEIKKVVVLINSMSASSSEILAGSLQDLDRAVVIGENSFGKGKIQQNFVLSNGGSISLTVGEYILPSGRSISKLKDSTTIYRTLKKGRLIDTELGVHPDIVMIESCDYKIDQAQRREFINFFIEGNILSNHQLNYENLDSIYSVFQIKKTDQGDCYDREYTKFCSYYSQILMPNSNQVRVSNLDPVILKAIEIMNDGTYETILN